MLGICIVFPVSVEGRVSRLPAELPPQSEAILPKINLHPQSILSWSTSAWVSLRWYRPGGNMNDSKIWKYIYIIRVFHKNTFSKINICSTTLQCDLLFSWWCYCAAVRVKMILKSVSGDSAGPALLWNSAISFRGRVQTWCGAEEDSATRCTVTWWHSVEQLCSECVDRLQ